MAPLAQPYNLFTTPKLTKPVQAYDPTKSVEDNMAGKGNLSAQNIISAYQTPQAQLQTQQQNPAPAQQQQNKPAITNMDELAAAMGYTSPEQEEKLRKASVANQRILALGDALRHIGNIATTINYAPSQQFNNPVQEEYARYERGKALRDKANQTYLTYQQAKAAQDAKQRQWEMQFRYNAAKDARDYELKKGESEARNNLREAQLNRYQTMIDLDKARKEGIISDNEYKKRRAELYPEEVRSRIAKNNRTGGGRSGGSRSRGGGGGAKYWAYDENGQIHYYPNKSMYEQGVYEFGQGQSTTEEYSKGKDVLGREQKGQRKRSVTSMGGERARQARDKRNQPATKKKTLPGQTPVQPQKPAKKRLPGT